MAQSLRSLIRSADKFGAPVQLNLKGSTEYQTLTGGLCSILISIVVLQFSSIKILQLANYDNQSITKNSIYHEGQFQSANELNFQIGVGFTKGNIEMLQLEGYGSLRAYSVVEDFEEGFKVKELQFQDCDNVWLD